MPRTPRDTEEDARLAYDIIRREARPMLQHEVIKRLAEAGRVQSKMQARATLDAAERLGLVRRRTPYWEAADGQTLALSPAVVPTAPVGSIAGELVELATKLLAVRPPTGILNETAGRLYQLAMTTVTPAAAPSAGASSAAAGTAPARMSASNPNNGAGKHDDLNIEVFRPIAS